MIRYAIVAAATLATASPALAQTFLNATFQNATVTTSELNPNPGQTFTITGGFTSYVASANLPQVTTDLPQYSFTVSGISQGFNSTTFTTTYGSVFGSIFYQVPGEASPRLVQSFTGGPLTARFVPTSLLPGQTPTAALLGSLFSTGPQNPFGLGPVDFSPANGAQITGTFISDGPSATTGRATGALTFASVAAVPEPATWAMMIMGFGLVGASMRRRKVAVSCA